MFLKIWTIYGLIRCIIFLSVIIFRNLNQGYGGIHLGLPVFPGLASEIRFLFWRHFFLRPRPHRFRQKSGLSEYFIYTNISFLSFPLKEEKGGCSKQEKALFSHSHDDESTLMMRLLRMNNKSLSRFKAK